MRHSQNGDDKGQIPKEVNRIAKQFAPIWRRSPESVLLIPLPIFFTNGDLFIVRPPPYIKMAKPMTILG
jgi:hypothetical protein